MSLNKTFPSYQCISRCPQLNNLREVENALQQEWNAIHQNALHRLIRSMRRRCMAFHWDPMCLSCVDELKLINDCASFFVCCHYQSSIYCCSQQKNLILLRHIYIWDKHFLVVHFQCCSIYIYTNGKKKLCELNIWVN